MANLSQKQKFLVTGATGTVGSEVVKGLAASGLAVRAGTRRPEKAPRNESNHVEYVLYDYDNPASLEAAMKGIDSLFLVTPPFHPHEADQGKQAVEAAGKARVKHIVRLSVIGADADETSAHGSIEKCIEDSGIAYTHLRPNFFMQNFNVFYAHTIKTENAFYSAGGEGRASWIDVRDIAAIAVQALVDPAHRNQGYTLTGGEALSNGEVAEIMSELLDRQITYVNVTDDDVRVSMRQMGMPEVSIEKLVALFPVLRQGWVEPVTPDTGQLLGRPPITVKQYVEDYARYFG